MHAAIVASITVTGITYCAMGDSHTPLTQSAPPIEVEHWVKAPGMDRRGNFDAPSEFGDGKIYVFDFWATWCAPCIASFPKVSQLQEQYADDGVVFVALSPEPLPLVVQFLQRRAGEETQYQRMGFLVGVDRDDSVRAALLPPEMRREIPMAAIVDRTGRLVYVGTTNEGFDQIVAQIVAGTWDAESHAAELEQLLAIKREKQRIQAEEDWPAALETFPDDAAFLTGIAFAIAYNHGGALENPDNAAATAMAERAVELTERQDAYSLHTLARCKFNDGDLEAAVALQQEAVDVRNATNQAPHYKEYYESTLATYTKALEDAG